MSKKNDGGPAFPVPNDANVNGQEGMSLRDYFAAKAMQVLLEKSDEWTMTFDDVADHAYAMADYMLAAREQQQ